MGFVFQRAKPDDAAAIAALRMDSARALTRQFGHGTWSFAAESEHGVRAELLRANVYVARVGARLVATLRLSQRKPWLGDIGFFSPSERPLYLTAFAVAPDSQRKGVGRRCLTHALAEARLLNADAVRLDCYDGPVGAAEFYRKCGFTEVHRAEYHGTPLVWFEALLHTASAENHPVRGSRRG